MPRSDRPIGAPIHDDEPESDDWGSMFNPMRMGSWSVSSASDPRWNMSGDGLVGGMVIPPDAAWAIREREKALGVKPPADLTYSYMKD